MDHLATRLKSDSEQPVDTNEEVEDEVVDETDDQ